MLLCPFPWPLSALARSFLTPAPLPGVTPAVADRKELVETYV